MFWLILSLFSAIFDSLRDIASKKSLKNVEPALSAAAYAIFAVPVTLIALLTLEKPVFDSTFWIIVTMHSAILAVATLIYMKSLKITDVSLAMPFTALTPAFMLVITPLLIGEAATKSGSTGVLLIALGAYMLNAGKAKGGFLEPLRAAVRDKGVMLMLSVALLWSITATIDRVAVNHASRLFYITIDYALMGLLLSINVIFSRKKPVAPHIKGNLLALAGIGAFFALGQIFYIYAIKTTIVSYAIAVKRTSVLFSVALGTVLFKEKNTLERFFGAALMVIGVAIISVF